METRVEEFVRETEEHERIARTVKCKSCGAPRGVCCAGLEWETKGRPVPFPRPHHAKRYKWAVKVKEKFGDQAGAA